MYGQQALEAFVTYLTGSYQCLILMVIAIARNDELLSRVLALIGSFFLTSAVYMARLESLLLNDI